jgi:hypothetical protein
MFGLKIKKILIAFFLLTFCVSTFFVYQKYFKLPVEKVSRNEEIRNEMLGLVKKDPKLAFSKYREILLQEPENHNICHGVAHEMGHEAFEALGFDKAMEYQDGLCGSGYVHGIVEARFGYFDTKNITKELKTICTSNKNACFHGIGHGLMIVTDLDTEESLKHCDKLPNMGPKNCYEGVWMHQFDLEETGGHAETTATTSYEIYEFAKNSEALCRNTSSKYKTSCYFYLPRIYAHIVEEPIPNLEKLCGMIDQNEYRVTCLIGTGHMLMKYHMADPISVFRKCEKFENINWHASCKEGGAMYYLYDSISSIGEGGDYKNICQVFSDKRDKSICTFVAWDRFGIK